METICGLNSKLPKVTQKVNQISIANTIMDGDNNKDKYTNGKSVPSDECSPEGNHAQKDSRAKVAPEHMSLEGPPKESNIGELTGATPVVGDNKGQIQSGAIVISPAMTGCVVVDLQGNMVLQGPRTDHITQGSYLMDDHVVVQVAQQAQSKHTNTAHTVGEMMNHSTGEVPIETVQISPNKKTNATAKNKESRQTNCESRFSFREVVKPQCQMMPLTEMPEEHFLLKDESDFDQDTRPRRKSAKKARLRWKNIHDVDTGGAGKAKRIRRGLAQVKDKADAAIAPEPILGSPPVVPQLPVWAKCLTSVRVLENSWVVGVAATSDVLHQTLESHSRSILCDYVKSHPCSLEKRHKAKCQSSRIMWVSRHIMFDGVPFSVLSSDELRCAFAMKYKAKKKKVDLSKGGGSEGEPRPEEETEDGRAGKIGDKTKGEDQGGTTKKYKDVTYTSCAARISVKVIVKYPGYALSQSACQKERKAMLTGLRRDLGLGLPIQKEELYHVMLPLVSVHNHPLQGRSRNIHPSVSAKVREYVKIGVTGIKVIKGLLDEHVKEKHQDDLIVPSEEDRAYYPRLKDISNLVYSYCKKTGISGKRRTVSQEQPSDTGQKKKKKSKRMKTEAGMEYGENTIEDSMPLQASTLQEAVQTFCTEEEREPMHMERECEGVEPIQRENASETSNLAEVIRGQLDTLRNLTFSLREVGPLQEMCQSLQVLISSVMTNSQGLALQENIGESGTATTFIIQDNLVNQLPSASSQSIENNDILDEREGIKNRSTTLSTPQVRQIRPPVALQCLSTLPTLSVPQITRPTHQTTPHMMASVPGHPNTTPVPSAQPTYQTLGPAPVQEPGAPVHVSLPPYFYYVQEVTVPESTQTWTYTSSS